MAEPQLSIVKSEPLPALTVADAPRGSAETRRDTSAIGIDHDAIVQGIANWASTLRPSLQKPAAFLATLPVDALASLVEMFSAPESLATMGAAPAVRAMDATAAAVGDTRAAMAPFAETVITKKLGMDPEAIQLQAAKLRLQAARSQTRQGRLAAQIAEAQPAATPAPPPAAPAAAAPTEFEAAQAARQASAAAAEPIVPASGKMKLTAAEMKEFSRLVGRGMTLPEAAAKVQAMRELASKLGGTMTPAEVAAEIKGRVGNLSPIR